MMTRAYDVISRRRRPHGVAAVLPWLLALATIAAQIAYPLVEGDRLREVTLASVVLFFLADVSHAWAHRGFGWAARLVVVSAVGGFLAELAGVRTGIPFGDYHYAHDLGPTVLDVPLVVPMAWTMMSYPVLLAARRLTRRFVPLVGGFGLAAWDVFLDPQMVADGRWHWEHPSPSLWGVPGVPLTNYLGWLVAGTIVMLGLTALLPRDRSSEAVPATLLLWTYVGSVVGNLWWFGSHSIALAGGIALGLLVLPYSWALWQSRP
jgi:putative membrane protein